MPSPFVIVSDLHFHNWSAFSKNTSQGNTRLLTLIKELKRAAAEVKRLGGNQMIVAGDVFHVRGHVAPSVLNLVLHAFGTIVEDGISVTIIPGNHDLEGDETSTLGSAVTALATVGCRTINEGPERLGDFLYVPWIENLNNLRDCLKTNQGAKYAIIHAPINGVIPGMPNIGLDPAELEALDYGMIFAGHYHNHKQFGQKVYSIGAIAHHSWNDVGSKAGFLVVDDDKVNWYCSHAPQFVELDPSMDEVAMRLAADGNFVKARIQTSDTTVIEDFRKLLLDAGAKGVVIMPDPVVKTVSRAASSIRKGMSLEESVDLYIKAGAFGREADLIKYCTKIIGEARA